MNARFDRYQTDNDARSSAAIEDHLARNHLTKVATSHQGPVGYVPDERGNSPVSPKTTLEVVARAPALGLRADEWLLRRPDDGKGPPQLVLASSLTTGCVPGGCGQGCERPIYAFATAPDGHLVILRLSPRVDEHRMVRSGTCSSGCGQPTPPPEPIGYGLPPTDAARVEISDGSYDKDTLRVRCMHEVPAP